MATIDYEVTKESLKTRGRSLVTLAEKGKLHVADLCSFVVQSLREMGLPKTAEKVKVAFDKSDILSTSKTEKTEKAPATEKSKKVKASTPAALDDKIIKLAKRIAASPKDKALQTKVITTLTKAYGGPDGPAFEFLDGTVGRVINYDKASGVYNVKGEGRGRSRKIHQDYTKKMKTKIKEVA